MGTELYKLCVNRFFLPLIILLVWLFVFLFNFFSFPELLGWDEIMYISEAKGIALHNDFGARQYVSLGLIDNGFPAHVGNYPIFTSILGGAMKIFGPTLTTAHMVNWFSALLICLFMYATTKLITENKTATFIAGISYLFIPGVMRDIDTGLMETIGALIVAIILYAIFYLYRHHPRAFLSYKYVLLFGLAVLFSWLFKTLLIGLCITLILTPIIFCYTQSNSITTSVRNGWKHTLATLFFFLLLLSFTKNYLFYPLIPLFVYDPKQVETGDYAEFAGGFFKHFPKNVIGNIEYQINQFSYHAVYRGVPTPYSIGFITFVRYYYVLLIVSLLLLIPAWKRMNSIQKFFSLFSATSLISYLGILHIIIRTVPENVHRYAIYYLPIYIIFVMLIIGKNLHWIKPFAIEYKKIYRTLITIIFFAFFVPLFLTMTVHQIALEKKYNKTGVINSETLKKFMGNSTPMFFYFNHGTHLMFTDYPMRQITLDVTGKEIQKLNTILPEPISYLFLYKRDALYKEYEQKILEGKPIISKTYTYIGSSSPEDVEYKVYAYKYHKN